MDKEEMKTFLEARGLWESKYEYLVGWQLAEIVEDAEDMGVPTLEEVKEMEEEENEEIEVHKAIEEKKKAKSKAKPKAKPKAKAKAKKE